MPKRKPTQLDIPRLRLANQHLASPTATDPVEVVRRLGAVQSQDYAGAKWAVGMRTNGRTDADVERALNDGSIVRTHALRPTWHFLAATDARWILALTAPRVQIANAHSYGNMEVNAAIFRKTDRIITKALAGGNHLTRAELGAIISRAGIDVSNLQRLAYLTMNAELNALIVSGPRRGKQFTYALFDERVPATKPLDRDEALAELARRYFTTRGPATVHDFSWWSGLTIADSRKAIALLESALLSEKVEEQTYWLAYDSAPPASNRNMIHLLPNFDEYFIGFKDRSAMLDVVGEFSLLPGNPMFTAHVLVHDGQLIGGWKRAVKPKSVSVDVVLLSKLTVPARKALLATAKQYGKFLGLPVELSGHD
jgi:DNA glycosylase AlkZ-like